MTATLELIPSSFLPHLPKSRTSLFPLPTPDLLSHIAILKELHLPPIHGGLRPIDASHHDEDESEGESSKTAQKRARRFSAGLSETMEGLGLGLDVPIPVGNGHSAHRSEPIWEESEDDDEEAEEEDAQTAHLDAFEREWSEKWLNGVVRRAQGWLEEHEEAEGIDRRLVREMEVVLRDATAALAMMAGTTAAGSLTRHLLFPLNPSLVPALQQTQIHQLQNPNLSPETNTFLQSLSTSPQSPIRPFLVHKTSSSPTYRRQSTSSSSPDKQLRPRRKRQRSAIPILLHDAPMSDHLSVGVQTWGSAILLGREMSLRPADFGLFQTKPISDSSAALTKPSGGKNMRVLELGAGTGLLSILCRKLLDLRAVSEEYEASDDVVVATDFLPDVLANLKICVDLNFPGSAGGIEITKLDWATFPASMESRYHPRQGNGNGTGTDETDLPGEEIPECLEEPFDLVIASDCVYDPTHAEMIRHVAEWVLRLPNPDSPDDIGGTMHMLSPLRPTFAPELQSIDTHFPTLSTYPLLVDSKFGNGEGLGRARGLRIGTRGDGKKSVQGRKGEGRLDEAAGYWWWEVGWG